MDAFITIYSVIHASTVMDPIFTNNSATHPH